MKHSEPKSSHLATSEPKSSHLATSEPKSSHLATSEPKSSHPVLIIEDGLTNIEHLCRFLNENAVTVERVSNCSEAHEKIKNQNIDLVLLWDESENNFKKLSHIREKHSKEALPALALLSNSSDLLGALNAGANDALTTPENHDLILEKIRALSEWKVLKGQLAQANKIVRETAEAKTHFLANMSHEIRTPLNAIIGMADVLNDTQLDDEQRHYVQIFQRAGENLIALVDDILDIAKIESGNFVIENYKFHLGELIQDICQTFRPKCEEKNLKLNSSMEETLCANATGDGNRIRQILNNLLGNAVKFTNSGQILIEVKPDSIQRDHIQFIVSDTGVGIDPSKLDKIFERFSQVDITSTRKFGGTGIGLSISKQLVSLMGGHISVRSEPDRGSTFTFSIPLMIELRPKTEVSSHSPSKNILVVDDEAVSRLFIKSVGTRLGSQVEEASSGEEALELIRLKNNPHHFGLLITDFKMPGMNGFELIEKVRALSEMGNFPTVMLTAGVVDDSLSKRLDFQLVSYAFKPVKRKDLEEIIYDLIARRSLLSRKILLIDNGSEICPLINEAIKNHGYQIRVAAGETDALNYLQQETADLILLDAHTISENHASLLKKIRKSADSAPLILVSGNSPSEEIRRLSDTLNVTFLLKPFSDAEIMNVLQNALKETTNTIVRMPERLKILLVDDSEANRILIKTFLKNEPVEITECENGQQALDQIQSNTYDVILMDMQMPVLDGYETTRRIRAWENENQKKPLAIMGLTADALPEHAAKVLQAGCNMFVPKPVRKKELIAHVIHFKKWPETGKNKSGGMSTSSSDQTHHEGRRRVG